MRLASIATCIVTGLLVGGATRLVKADCVAPDHSTLPSGCMLLDTTRTTTGQAGMFRNKELERVGPSPATPPPGGSLVSFFDVFATLELSQDAGETWHNVHVSGTGQQRVYRPTGADTYETELLELTLTGGELPPGMSLRERADQVSQGNSTISPLGGGYSVSSFFDVFTELSLDGGTSWQPADAPWHLTLQGPTPTATRPTTWGSLKLLYR